MAAKCSTVAEPMSVLNMKTKTKSVFEGAALMTRAVPATTQAPMHIDTASRAAARLTASPEMSEASGDVAKSASIRDEKNMKEALTKLKVARESIVLTLNELAEVVAAGPYCDRLNGKLTFELEQIGAD